MAAVAGAPSAADAVDVVLRLVGQIEVHHMRQLVDVDAAGGNIGGHQHAHLAALEARQGAGAGPLALVAVDGGGLDALLREPLGNAISAVLGSGEHQHLLPVVAADQMTKQLRLAVHIAGMEHMLHRCGRAVLRRGLQLHGVVQQAGGQLLDRGLEGGREQQVLSFRRQQRQDLLDVTDEAHVEHAIGLIEHQDLDAIELDGVLLSQIHQPAWRGHQHIGAAAQAHHLRVDLHTAKHPVGAQIKVARIGRHVLTHLGRQFAGGGEHQGSHDVVASMGPMPQPLQHRQGEPGGLARAGLSRGHHITALQHCRNALLLNRRRRGVALLQHRLHDRPTQAEGGEG